MSERAQTSETTIVRAAIYPAIGIARVGNSQSEYFLGTRSRRPAVGDAGLLPRPGRRTETPSSAISGLWFERRGRSSRRTYRRKRRDSLDRTPRQQEVRLVPVPDRARHSGGQFGAAVLAAQHDDQRPREPGHRSRRRAISSAAMPAAARITPSIPAHSSERRLSRRDPDGCSGSADRASAAAANQRPTTGRARSPLPITKAGTMTPPTAR